MNKLINYIETCYLSSLIPSSAPKQPLTACGFISEDATCDLVRLGYHKRITVLEITSKYSNSQVWVISPEIVH